MFVHGFDLVDEKIVRPKALAARYLDQLERQEQVTRGSVVGMGTYDIRTYTSLRLEYRLVLADTCYRDYTVAVEAAAYLQQVVDLVATGGQEVPTATATGRLMNRVERDREMMRMVHERAEIKSQERLTKRRLELKLLLENRAKADGSRPSSVVARDRPGMEKRGDRQGEASVEGSGRRELRTPKYLSMLKAKAEDIKKMKAEAVSIAEQEKVKQRDLVLFIKKKKNQDFLASKVKEYDEGFSSIFRHRSKEAAKQADTRRREEETLQQELADSKRQHHADVEDHRRFKKMLKDISDACIDHVAEERPDLVEAFDLVFEKYNKTQDPWTVLSNDDLKHKLSNKIAQKVFTDSQVVPEVISLKRILELVGHSSKVQANHAFMTLADMKNLCCHVAVDVQLFGMLDPYFTRSRRLDRSGDTSSLHQSAMLNQSAVSRSPKTPKSPKTPVDELLHHSMTLAKAPADSIAEKFKVKNPTLSLVKSSLGRLAAGDIDRQAVMATCLKIFEMVAALHHPPTNF